MYELLQEEDMWSGLWQKHARYRETNVAIAYEQQGFFEQAQVCYWLALDVSKFALPIRILNGQLCVLGW